MTFCLKSETFQTDDEEQRPEGRGGRGTGHCVRLDNRAATASHWSTQPRPSGIARMAPGDFREASLVIDSILCCQVSIISVKQ